jgi:RNA recognition motif. (a.k.a. RRM, RBD, or RNP domain)
MYPVCLRVLICLFLQAKLPPGANRILFVKNLNYQITGDDLYDLFGRYGSIRQIRIGNEAKTKGTGFVVFDDVMDVRPPATLCAFPLPSRTWLETTDFGLS